MLTAAAVGIARKDLLACACSAVAAGRAGVCGRGVPHTGRRRVQGSGSVLPCYQTAVAWPPGNLQWFTPADISKYVLVVNYCYYYYKARMSARLESDGTAVISLSDDSATHEASADRATLRSRSSPWYLKLTN